MQSFNICDFSVNQMHFELSKITYKVLTRNMLKNFKRLRDLVSIIQAHKSEREIFKCILTYDIKKAKSRMI